MSYVQHSLQQPSFTYSGSRSEILWAILCWAAIRLQMMFSGIDQNSYTINPISSSKTRSKPLPASRLPWGCAGARPTLLGQMESH